MRISSEEANACSKFWLPSLATISQRFFLKVPHNLSFFVTISAPFQKWTRTIIASIKRTRAIWPQFLRKILSVFKRLISTRHQFNIMYRIRNCPPSLPNLRIGYLNISNKCTIWKEFQTIQFCDMNSGIKIRKRKIHLQQPIPKRFFFNQSDCFWRKNELTNK